ncbi:Carboxylesterase, partial [Opisthorchis viverrini]
IPNILLSSQFSTAQTQSEYKRPPVVLFVHGESYEYGSGNAYDLSVLAGFTGAVCITLNYRLGLLGFLSLKDGQSNGNFALFDLQAALLWIRTNIARFGGDPEQITLMGYGHGAALIHLFSLSKLSQGFGAHGIRRIILLNGSSLAAWATSGSEELVMRELAKQLNITDAVELENSSQMKRTDNQPAPILGDSSKLTPLKTHSEVFKANAASVNQTQVPNNTTKPKRPSLSQLLVNRLKQLSFDNLVRLQKNLTALPCAERLGPVVSKHLFTSLLSSDKYLKSREKTESNNNGKPWTSLFSKVDLMIGFVKQAADRFYSRSKTHGIESSSLLQCLHFMYPQNQQVISDVLQYLYKDFPIQEVGNTDPSLEHPDHHLAQMLTILSDGFYRAPAFQTASLHRKLSNTVSAESKVAGSRKTFLASFTHQSTSADQSGTSELRSKKVLHGPGFGEDLAYVLGAPLVSPNRVDPFDGAYSRYDATISQNMLNYIANFINTGNPNKSLRKDNSENSSNYWPEYDDHTKVYLNIGSRNSRSDVKSTDFPCTIEHGSQDKKLPIWTELLPRLAGLPSTKKSHNPTQKHEENSESIEKHQNTTLGSPSQSQNSGSLQTEFERWLPVPGSIQSYLYFFHLRDRQRACSGTCVSTNVTYLTSARVFLPDHASEEDDGEQVSGGQSFQPIFDDYVVPKFEGKQLFQLPQTETVPSKRNVGGQSEALSAQQRRIEFNPITRTALLWTIATGLTLFLLNALVFIGIYYQAHRLRSDHAMFEDVPAINTQNKTPAGHLKRVSETRSSKVSDVTASNSACVPQRKIGKPRPNYVLQGGQSAIEHEPVNCEDQGASSTPLTPLPSQPPRPSDGGPTATISPIPQTQGFQHVSDNAEYRWQSSKPMVDLSTLRRMQLPFPATRSHTLVNSSDGATQQVYFGPYCAY